MNEQIEVATDSAKIGMRIRSTGISGASTCDSRLTSAASARNAATTSASASVIVPSPWVTASAPTKNRPKASALSVALTTSNGRPPRSECGSAR